MKPSGFFEATEMPAAGWWEALWPDPVGLLTAVGIKPGMEVIDLCSGDDWFTLQIAKLARHVVAIDVDPARALKRAACRTATSWSATPINWPDSRLGPSILSSWRTLSMVSPIVPGWRPPYAALKPGGHFAIVNWHQRPREQTMVLGEPLGPKTDLRLSPAQTAEAVVAGGLTYAGTIEVPPYHYAALFERPAA
jgi:hypothetical protein